MEGHSRAKHLLGASHAVLAAGLLACAWPAPARAQSADGVTIETIVVTAQKRSERLQDVPISITALSKDQLKTAGVTELSDISAITPGLQFEQQGGFFQPTIRGVGTSNEVAGAGTNVGVYIDGFLMPNPGTSEMQMLNISSIQVLKGPQGTLFGRNTTGGAILLTTSEPSQQPSMTAEAALESHNAQRYEFYGTTGYGDRIAVDLAAQYNRGDGWIRNIATGHKAGKYDGFSVRAGLKVNVTDNAYLLFRYTHAESNDPAKATYGALCCNSLGLPYTIGAFIPGTVIGTKPNEVAFDAQPVYKPKVDTYQLTGVWDLPSVKLTSYTQYRRDRQLQSLDLDGSTAAVAAFAFGYRDKYFTQEFLASSKGNSKLQWVAGLYYFYDKAYDFNTGSFGGTPFVFFNNNNATIKSLAGYVDATYQVTDKLYVSAGLRLSHDKYYKAFDDLGAIFGGPYTLHFDPVSDTRATPRAVVRYNIAENTNVYASFTRGYKSGLRNIGAYSNALVEPETLSAYEIGFKTAQRAVSFNISAYYYDYNNLQVESFTNGNAIVQNAATSRIYGVDGDVRYVVNSHLEVAAAAAYTDAKYKSFTEAPLYAQCLSVSCGAGFGFSPAVPVDLKNSPMHFAPKFSGNVSARYTTDLAGGELVLSSILSYTSKQYLDLAARFAAAAHEDLSLRIQWTDPSKRYVLAAYAQNLTDKRYRNEFVGVDYGLLSSWNAPRIFGASVAVHY
jgi:iron complex outermembrane receptor protein